MLATTTDAVQRIERLFAMYGSRHYDGPRSEPVTALEHALQCAERVERQGGSPALVVAALLHDLGHFPVFGHEDDRVDDAHEIRALPFLENCFGPEVTEPIRLHVEAKRYLVAVDDGYRAQLSPASVHSLALQGGAYAPADALRFRVQPFAMDAVALRRCDDAAKVSGARTASLDRYLDHVERVARKD